MKKKHKKVSKKQLLKEKDLKIKKLSKELIKINQSKIKHINKAIKHINEKEKIRDEYLEYVVKMNEKIKNKNATILELQNKLEDNSTNKDESEILEVVSDYGSKAFEEAFEYIFDIVIYDSETQISKEDKSKLFRIKRLRDAINQFSEN